MKNKKLNYAMAQYKPAAIVYFCTAHDNNAAKECRNFENRDEFSAECRWLICGKCVRLKNITGKIPVKTSRDKITGGAV